MEEYMESELSGIFRVTLVSCLFNSLRKSVKIFNKSPVTPFCFNLKIRPLSQTYSKALEISRKIPLTSKSLSNDL